MSKYSLNYFLIIFLMYGCVSHESTEDTDEFFNIRGITLGKTNVKEINSMGYPCKGDTDRDIVCDIGEVSFWDFDNDGIVENVSFFYDDKLPEHWQKKLGFDLNMSYNDWVKTIKALGFTIQVVEKPKIKTGVPNTFEASIVALSKTRNTEIDLEFAQGNENYQGCDRNSLNTLNNITVTSNGTDFISKNELTQRKNKNILTNNENREKNCLFPIYGIILSKTRIEELEKIGYFCESGYCDVNEVTFWDNDEDGIIDEMNLYNFNEIPFYLKESFDFNWRSSYNDWVRILENMEFNIMISESPHHKLRGDRKTFEAEITATSSAGNTQIVLTFSDGNENNEGYDENSLNSLLEISINSIGVDNICPDVLGKNSIGTQQCFFPIYSITPGENNLEEIEKMGYSCEKEYGISVCIVNDINFADFNNDGIVEHLQLTCFQKMPNHWKKNFKFNWSNSYTEWIDVLEDTGFIIEESEITKTHEQKNKNSKVVIAKYKMGDMKIILNFDNGNNATKDFDKDYSNSLFSITLSGSDFNNFCAPSI